MEDNERVEVAEDFRKMSSLHCEVKLELDNKCDSNIGVILTVDKEHIVKEEGIPGTLTGIADHPELIDCVKQEHASDSGDESDNEEKKEALSLSCIAGTSSGACEDVDQPELVDYIKLEKLEHDSDNSDSFEDNMVSEDHDSKTIIEHSLEEIKDESSAESCLSTRYKIVLENFPDLTNDKSEETKKNTENVRTLTCPLVNLPNRTDSKSKKLQCNLCEYCTTYRGVLNKHISLVHLKERKHKCQHCDYSTPRKNRLEHHINMVHLKLGAQKCNHCDHIADSHRDLTFHVSDVHTKERIHKCHLCNFNTAWKRHLQLHIDGTHLKLIRYDCNLCDYSTYKKKSLKCHNKNVHAPFESEKCPLCDYIATERGQLKRHKYTHNVIENHICFLCGYTATSKRTLTTHRKSVHFDRNNK